MFGKTVWEAAPADTVIHRLDGRTKLLILAASAFLSITVDSPRTLFLLFMAMLSLHVAARSSLDRWRILLLFLLLGIWGAMVSQALFYNQEPRTVVACLASPSTPVVGRLTGGIFLYSEGLEYGAVQALRSGIMLTTGLLICWTTDPRQLLKSFLAWKMPYELSFMLITGIRFLPVIFNETAVVLTAQRLRGFEPLKALSPRKMIQTAFQTLFPILARTLRRAATLTYSVESRGFGRKVHVVNLPRWPAGERYICFISLSLLAVLLLLKLLYALQFNGLIYVAGLRGMYDFIKLWM
ncbi:MAG: energy-coupling factor transporter transmembrane component T [Veillonellales bacterium]